MISTKVLYERLAFLYDLDDVMCMGAKQHWRKKIIKDLKTRSNSTLDIATGTGRMAKILCSNLKNGQIIGVDLSKNMLRIAKIRNRNQKNLSLIQCNAEQLPFRDEIFDTVTCTYGMDTFCHPETVFSEAVRVLKCGGRMGLIYFAKIRTKNLLKYLEPSIKKFYKLVWHAKDIDMLSIMRKYSLKKIRSYDLLFTEALIVEKL
ncbi:MAG: class I SAM-dependent methyltransferase [bacterium]|nr:class I SAM-dependent methyltransferase [bacterium]